MRDKVRMVGPRVSVWISIFNVLMLVLVLVLVEESFVLLAWMIQQQKPYQCMSTSPQTSISGWRRAMIEIFEFFKVRSTDNP